MRRARAADRSAAEQRAAQVGAPAARPPDDPARRPLERRAAGVEDARLVEDAQRVRSALDVQLVARRSGERALPVRAELGADADVAQQPERAPGDGRLAHVEVQRDLAAPVEVEPPGRVEEPGELSEPVAVRRRARLARARVSDVFRERHASSARQHAAL